MTTTTKATTADKNCISYWLPRLQSAGLPTPRTSLVKAPDLRALLDGKTPEHFSRFLGEVTEEADKLGGWPLFLRTGHGSNKHGWRHSCFVPDADALPLHIHNLVEWSECVSILGLPYKLWALRELLPTVPQFVAFDGMPICREFRYFVRDGEVRCSHPYWPRRALEQGFPVDEAQLASIKETGSLLVDLCDHEDTIPRLLPADWEHKYACLCYLPAGDAQCLDDLASAAGKALGGAWSVDILETRKGWYVTDVAVASDSYHWDGCPRAVEFSVREEP